MSKRTRLLHLAERATVFVATVTVLAFAYFWLVAPVQRAAEAPASASSPPSAAPHASASASAAASALLEPAEAGHVPEGEEELDEYACVNE